MQATTKDKVEGSEVGSTRGVNPTPVHIPPTRICKDVIAGQEQIIAYIVGDMTRAQCRAFVAHTSECWYCMREVVLWRAAQVATETQDQSSERITYFAPELRIQTCPPPPSPSLIIEHHDKMVIRSRISHPTKLASAMKANRLAKRVGIRRR